MATVITSPHNKHCINLNKLKTAQGRKHFGQFLAEGKRLVDEAINAKVATQIIFSSDYPYEKIYDNDIILPSNLFNKYASTETPQGIMAICDKLPQPDLKNFDNYKRIIICSVIQDPGNLGNIIRTANALGVDCVVLSKGCVDLYNDKVIRSTMGAIFNVPILTDIYLLDFVDFLHEKGIRTIGLSLDGDNIYELPKADKNALIVGNEALGIDIRLQEKLSTLAKIPMFAGESLNAATSVAVAGYELTRKRLYDI